MFAPRFAAVLALILMVPAGAHAADLDPYLPADTESFLSVNVRQLLDSPIIKKSVLGPLRNALKESQDVTDVLKDLGFDPLKDLDHIIIAGPGGAETDRGLIIVHGTFDVKKFQAKAADAAQNNDDVLKIHKVPLGGGATHEVYEVNIPGQDGALFVALASGKTLLVSPGKDYVVDSLKQSRANAKPALKSKSFQALLEKMDSKQSLSLAVPGKKLIGADDKADFLPRAVRDALAKIEVIGGGLTISEEVKFDLYFSTKDETSPNGPPDDRQGGQARHRGSVASGRRTQGTQPPARCAQVHQGHRERESGDGNRPADRRRDRRFLQERRLIARVLPSALLFGARRHMVWYHRLQGADGIRSILSDRKYSCFQRGRRGWWSWP